MYQILEKKSLNKDVDLLKINAPFVAKNAKPGHFLIIRVDQQGERIPLTIVDHTSDTVTIIYQKLGYSTRLLSTLNVGEYIEDVVGPLGKDIHLRDSRRILAVAGGVGAAPLYPQLVAYKENSVNIDLVIGARTKEHIILLDEYKKICDNVYITTDDGSLGKQGFVTDLIPQIIQNSKYDHAIVIGPLIMMKNTVELLNTYQIPSDVSLNPVMIDGTGMCGNCRVTKHDKTYFACIDGPDFSSDGIDFDELLVRQNYYKDQEHVCNIKLVKS